MQQATALPFIRCAKTRAKQTFVHNQLNELEPLLSAEYKALLDSPMIDLEKRLDLVDEAFSGKICEYVLNF